MEDMHDAMDSFWGSSRAYIMVGPRDRSGDIGVRFSGTENDLRYMFQEIGTYLYEARIITAEQWRAVCSRDERSHH